MSRWYDRTDDEQREQKRQEERNYRADVTYDVWRSGRDPDRVDYDRVTEHMLAGDRAEDAAAHEIRIQREAQERRQMARDEEMRQEQEEYERQRIESEQRAAIDAAASSDQEQPQGKSP